MRIIITGEIPSTKNIRRVITRGGRTWAFSPKAKETEAIVWQIKQQFKKGFGDEEVSVLYKIFCKTRRKDRSNMITEIDDCLQKSGLINNDKQIVRAESEIFYKAGKDEAIIIIKKALKNL